jgi:arginine deiminase
MADVVRDENLRSQFLDQWIVEAGVHSKELQQIVHDYLDSEFKDPKALVEKTMEGINTTELGTANATTLAGQVGDPSGMFIDPMPNLYFTRDPFAMVGNGVTIHRMFSVTRNRETLYGQYIFDNHPDFKGTPQYYRRDYPSHIEGGDVLNINDHVLAVGISQRTEAAAIDTLAAGIFADETSTIDTILAFDIPVSRAFMHLDTVFTQIDVDKFTIHPGILGPLTVYELTPGAGGKVVVKRLDSDLETILSKYVGQPVKLLQCGAGDAMAADREQWNDGSNTLCIRPGTICVYQRNTITNEFLDKEGLDLKVVPSAELSRGRGGPRCMSMPAWRENL